MQKCSTLFRTMQKVSRISTTAVEARRILLAFSLGSFANACGLQSPFCKQEKQKVRYWVTQDVNELVEHADYLYENEKYLEVYELLNRIHFRNNVDVLWRICRALYKLSQQEGLDNCIKMNILTEGYDLISYTMSLEDSNSEVHKWMAILLDAKTGLEGVANRVKVALQVKAHMLKSAELNPKDPTVFYMLGYWCFEMSKLTWLQRNIAKLMFYDPPKASYEEAYSYFLKAEEIRPRFFIGNIYMLGKCCYEMGRYYRARYYLKLAAELPAENDVQKKQKAKATKLAEELGDYDVAINALGIDVKPNENTCKF